MRDICQCNGLEHFIDYDVLCEEAQMEELGPPIYFWCTPRWIELNRRSSTIMSPLRICDEITHIKSDQDTRLSLLAAGCTCCTFEMKSNQPVPLRLPIPPWSLSESITFETDKHNVKIEVYMTYWNKQMRYYISTEDYIVAPKIMMKFIGGVAYRLTEEEKSRICGYNNIKG